MNTSPTEKWNVLISPWFYFTLFLFVIHQILQWVLQINISFLDNYLDPFLFLPIALGAYLQERRLFLKNDKFTLGNFSIIGLSVILILIVEMIFPFINSGYTFDVYDFGAYGAGAFYFQFTLNRLD